MAVRGTIAGFYQDRDTASAVLRELRRQGFPRSAAIYAVQEGRTDVRDFDLSPLQGAFLGGGVGLCAALAVNRYFASFFPSLTTLQPSLIVILVTLASAALGALLARLTDFGVCDDLIARYRRWIVQDEAVILVQVPLRDMDRVVDVLRAAEGGPPIIFAFPPKRALVAEPPETLLRSRPLTAERLSLEAGRVAASLHAVSRRRLRARPLLGRLRECEHVLGYVQEVLTEASRMGQAVAMSAEWLLDNAYLVRGHVEDIRHNLPRRYYERLPVLESGRQAGLPRVYGIACEVIADTDARLDSEILQNFLQSYQTVSPLTIGELWALPLMLRFRLIECLRSLALQVERRQRERDEADLWANRLLTAVRRDPERLLPLLAELAREQPSPSPHLADQLVGHLYDEEAALSPVRGWLERKLGAPLPEVIQQEHRDQAAEQVSLANAITSLRRLGQIDWRTIFESVSRVDAILWTDPAGIYARMDFETRDHYRHAVEEIARRATRMEYSTPNAQRPMPVLSEIQVALRALELADAGEEELTRHVGYYLVDEGRATLEASVGYRPTLSQRARRWARRHPTPVYLGSIGILTAATLAGFLYLIAQAGIGVGMLVVLGLLSLLPASEVALQVVNYLVTRLLPPHILPKMYFAEGIPDEFRTLVVVPMMLLTPEAIRDQVEWLEIRYLANPDPNLRFALLSDFSDAPQQHMPEDAERLEIAVVGIEELNRRHGDGMFFLFHRERKWCESEQCWMGWERKRGKIEQLNRFLMGEADPELDAMLRVGDPERLRGIRFVITLDADTQLPRDTARRLVETLAHPLNQPHLSIKEECAGMKEKVKTSDSPFPRVTRGYTILQPRVSTSLPSATATLFSRLFTDTTGVDPYTHAVSDVYQDLAGEGCYHGKGIYDLHTFHRILSGRFPQSHLLSHDLIEGIHVRVGFVSDIELLDLFPRDYVSYAGRQHRWVRGDWQIVDWLFPTVPVGGQKETPNALENQIVQNPKSPNPLSIFNRWKIFDNLRRSLLPLASTLLLIVGWLFTPTAALISLAVTLTLLLPPLALLATRLTTRIQPDVRAWRDLGTGLMRALVLAALLPHQAALSVDAIARVAYRRLKSHRLLLEWETAQVAHQRARNRQRQFLLRMAWIPVCAVLTLTALVFVQPTAVGPAEPFIALWLICPALIAWLNTSQRPPLIQSLSESDTRMLRQIARLTWRFFDDFVGPETHYLPPDNYQEFLRVEVAQRTSPTNIGLGLLATLAARDFGYVTPDAAIERTLETMQTLDRLERYEGHLLNWYDIGTLEPLAPRYVSMVDSGNLLACLLVLEHGLEELCTDPVIGPSAQRGLADTLALLQHLPGSEEGKERAQPNMSALSSLCARTYTELPEIIRCIRSAAEAARALAQNILDSPSANETRRYWAQQVERQTLAWNTVVDRYLAWVDLLESPPEGGLLALSPEAHEWRRQALTATPSLRMLAEGNVPGLSSFLALHRRADDLSLPVRARVWLNSLAETASRAQWLAGERLAQAQEAIRRARDLADGMNMRFLYNAERRLFHTGYNVSERRMDVGFYDLLASEARIGSLVCIARGEIPVEHWWAMGRPFAEVNGQRVLLSWNGTMFEYLMPLLFTRSFENSLLDEASRTAVAIQIAYGRQRGIPWGISESAFSALDAHQIYQYRGFGIPGLGLKRGLEEDLVVAPYATALALAVDPAAAVQNLRRLSRLARLGMRGGYGYYEAIDYTRQHGPHGERGVIVYTYMAHHQSMILLSIDNTLNDHAMQKRFHADPRIKATESLLYERIPIAPTLTTEYAEETPLPRLTALPSVPATGRVDTADTPVPRTHLLSNGAYSVMVTNSGGGYSRWRDFEISRWRADTTRDSYGAFCFVKDMETGAVWSTGYQPFTTTPQRYSVLFTPDKAEFRRREAGIETLMEVVVSPEDDAEVRRITLVNRSLRTRQVELTSYVELALAPHNADRAHPAFSKLFVQTENLPDQGALLAWRRPRSAHDAGVWAVHVVATETGAEEPIPFETDRARFLGRGRTPSTAQALNGELTHTAGAVLDPIFSLRRRLTIEAGQRVQVAFVTGAAQTREEAVALAEKYADLRASQRALEMAWTHAQLELRHLRAHQDDIQRYQQLASYVLYPSALLRPAPERLRRNTLGQTRLWAYGISGDLPILLITIGDPNDVELVRQVLMAHTYWRLRGLKVDLVILNEESDSYHAPLQEQLRRLIQAHSQYTGIDQPGGVFLRPVGQIPEEDMILLQAVARVTLVAARGSLAQQLGTSSAPVALPPLLEKNPQAREEPSPPLPYMELPYFNGLGGFTPDGKEYAIYLGPDDQTPMPWSNVIANPSFGTLVTESGAGFTWYGNSQSNRLTPWSNDPISDPVGDAIYIRDEEMGVVWTPTPLPIRELDAYRARHGQGYTVFEHNSHAIEQELTVFVPIERSSGPSAQSSQLPPNPEPRTPNPEGAPVRIQRLRLRNRSSRRRRLAVTSYAEWVLGVEREESHMHVVTNWDAESRSVFARNVYHPDFGGRVAFAACSPPPTSYTGDRTEFLGRNGSPASPAAMNRTRLADRTGAGLDPCAALQTVVEIDPGQEVEVIFLLGQAANAAEARTLIARYRSPLAVEQALKATRAWWDDLLDAVQVETPDLAVNFLLNRWLLYQDLSCRIWGRSAFYQSGGAFGFRDQLQDVMAVLYAAPQIAREQILRAASRQFVEGDVQHWWHPPSGAGVRTRISDDLLWLPFVTAHYVRVTGDDAILDEEIPFLEGRLLEEEEHESYFIPTISAQKATLLEHCRRAVTKGATAGPHGLPLIGGGDWNDGLNRVGVEGKGESVWLAWFLIHVMNDLAELLERRGKAQEAEPWRRRAQKQARTVEEQAWDGEWYRRAYFDDGEPLGSKECDEAQIDSLPQSWAILSGAGDPERAAMAMNAVDRHLVREADRMILLFTPPFDKSPKYPGYIKGYLPGVRENGGQYTHGSLWVPMAFARRGEGDRAVALLQMMNPVEHARTPEESHRYKVEPYVVAADIYALENQVGRGGWTWYTGSAGWMYRIWLEEVLGFQKRGDRLLIDPRISSEWPGFKLSYRFGQTWYNIAVENPEQVRQGVCCVEMDGAPLPTNEIPLQDDGKRHTVVVRLGASNRKQDPQ